MSTLSTCARRGRVLVWLFLGLLPVLASAASSSRYELFVSNEKSGDLTVIDGNTLQAVATIPVGKRPRGIHASPDGRTVYVALSGTPIEGPPKLDAAGNPIFKRGGDDDDDDSKVKADKSADGIGVVDVAQRKLIEKLSVGSDPEEFALSADGRRLYVSNEDYKAATVVDIAARKTEHLVLVGQEPEGVAVTPDGKAFYVTCEAGGDIFVFDTATYKTIAHFKVRPRPRSVAFTDGGRIAFIPSESAGLLNVIDAVHHKVLKVLTMPTGFRPMRVKVAPNGSRIYVSGGRSGTVAVIDAHSYRLLRTIKVGVRPWGIVLSPDGKRLFAANGPSNDVSVVDLRQGKEIARIKAGQSPWGIALVRTGH